MASNLQELKKSTKIRGLISSKYINSSIGEVLIEDINYCVYFITDGEYIKIGIAASLPNRVRQLQTGNARRLKALYVIPQKNQKESLNIERTMHEYFNGKRMNGEWFDIEEKDIHTICKRFKLQLCIPKSKFDFEIDGIQII